MQFSCSHNVEEPRSAVRDVSYLLALMLTVACTNLTVPFCFVCACHECVIFAKAAVPSISEWWVCRAAFRSFSHAPSYVLYG